MLTECKRALPAFAHVLEVRTVFEFQGLGVDPNLDPELALALRVSLEEEQARQQRAQQGEGGTENGTEQNIGANQAGEGPSQPVVPSTGGQPKFGLNHVPYLAHVSHDMNFWALANLNL